jgi:hypothetical protein
MLIDSSASGCLGSIYFLLTKSDRLQVDYQEPPYSKHNTKHHHEACCLYPYRLVGYYPGCVRLHQRRDDQHGPSDEDKRNLKGRVNDTTTNTPNSQKTNPRRMVHIPAESRIVGGTDAAQGDYPFFAQGNGCGASLIWEDVVLTAAHCLGVFADSVLVGPSIAYSTTGGAELIETLLEVPHPSYDSGTTSYDFMLVKLAKPVSDPALTSVAVNRDMNTPTADERFTVIGFGTTSEGAFTGSELLQKVNVNYVDSETCNAYYNGDYCRLGHVLRLRVGWRQGQLSG